MLPAPCHTCRKRAKAGSQFVSCSVCMVKIHKKCIPNVFEDEFNLLKQRLDWICTHCIELSMPFSHIVDDDEFLSAVAGCASMYKFE